MAGNTDTEQDILEHALQAVARETGVRLRIGAQKFSMGEQGIAVFLRLEGGERAIPIRVRRWAQQANLGALIHQIQQLPQRGMLVADYIDPRMADELRKQGVQFIDMAGNAYIDQPPVYVYVTGRRSKKQAYRPSREGVSRAFEPKGLRVVFAFLCDPELVAASYRQIAARAGVAVGTVGWVVNGLKAAGFIREGGAAKGRRLVQYCRLLTRWVETYPEKLRPKLLLGEFMAEDPGWWKKIDISSYDGCWGGEIAGARYTEGYLKPQEATLYLPEQAMVRLLRDARLRKAGGWGGNQGAKLVIYQPFWSQEPLNPACNEGVVHPLLAYADLIATADPRNLEAAQKIHDRYIAQYCRED